MQNFVQKAENRILDYLIRQLCLVAGREHIAFSGHIRFRRIPDDWSEEEYRRLWLPEWNDSHTKIIRQSIITPKEKDRYTVHETHNALTTSGRQEILTYLSSTAANTPAFGQYFALGTGVISQISPGNSQLSGEIFRAVPGTATITGTQIDLATLVGSSSAVGTLTNSGLFGVSATATTNSGTLMAQALINNFVKANGQVYTVDYILGIN